MKRHYCGILQQDLNNYDFLNKKAVWNQTAFLFHSGLYFKL